MAKITALDVADQLTGDEHLPIVQGLATKRVTMRALRDLITPFLQYWYKGDTGPSGPADAYRIDLAALKAAAIADGKSDFDGSTWYWSPGDYSAASPQDVDSIIVESDHAPLTDGAWLRQQASALVYRPRFRSSPAMPQSERNDEKISFREAMTPTMRNLTDLGRYVDVGPCVQAIIEDASGARVPGNAVGGKTLEIGGGRYHTSVPFDLTWRRDSQIVDDGDLRRLNILAEGSNNTEIHYFGPADRAAMQVAGYRGMDVNDGVLMRTRIQGLRIRRSPLNARTGVGLLVDHVVGLRLDDVMIDGFDLGVAANDVIQFRADELQLLTCNVGMRAKLGDFTNPNVFQMRGGQVSGTRDIGIHLIRPANGVLDTVRFENCGADPDNSTTILCELGTPEGSASLTVFNCYFENCMGNADLQLAHGYPYNGMVKFYMNTCHRAGPTRYVKHHIDAAITGAAASAGVGLVIDHGPQEYKNLAGYIPSLDRAAVRIQTPGIVLVENPGNRYPTALDRPQTNGFPAPGHTVPVLSATIEANSLYDLDPLYTINVDHVVHTPGSGIYRIFYRTQPADPLRVNLTVSLFNARGTATVSVRANEYVEVTTLDPAGDAADLAFTINGLGAF